jgi:hypothetical protein
MAEEDYNIGSNMVFDIQEASTAAIVQYINFVDQGEPWDLLPEDAYLFQLKDYYTKAAYKTNPDGSRTRVRGPLANSLEEGLANTVRIGKVKWITVLDRNTGKRDRELNGTKWRVEDPAAPIPPLHIGCRCRREPVVDSRGFRSKALRGS